MSEIRSDILAIELDYALCEEVNFNKRADALDFLDFNVLDRIESFAHLHMTTDQFIQLKTRATNLKLKLEKIDIGLFQRLRCALREVSDKKLFFRETILKYFDLNIDQMEFCDNFNYDNLDLFVNALFFNKPFPEPAKGREAGMVFYQKTPVRKVFEMLMLANAKPHDVFFDLGSGLGQVVILANIISGIAAIGIEFDPAYCGYAKQCASKLNLPNARFINSDARFSDYSYGTIFFLYTPFEGKLLKDVMNILERLSQKKAIKIFTYGPCSLLVGQLSWLKCVTAEARNIYQLYEFHRST